MTEPKSLAVVYASEGTGHKTAAFAICEAFLAACPDGHVYCCDVLDIIPKWMKYIVSEGYVAMARYAPWMWGSFYWGSDKPGVQAGAFEWAHSRLCGFYLPRLLRMFDKNGVQAAVFTHYFGADPTARRLAGKTPVFYADTDFESHQFQRRSDFAWNFAGSPRAVRQRLADGITNVSDTGVPIAQKYKKFPSKEAARETLGLAQDRPVILVSGGGIGAGSVTAAAKSLSQHHEWQTVVICGSNHKLYAKLKSWFQCRDNVRVEGFVKNMEDYYAAADCAVMKPGGLSASEALAAGLPMLLIDPVPGQEELNMAWLTSNGAAQYLMRPQRAGSAAERILSDGSAQKMREAALSMARPNAADDIVQTVLGYME